jgi:hypothetical protein
MTVRRRVIEMLLGTYPAAWRREYGAELVDLLASHPLGVRVVVDVLWNGFQQRVRAPESALPLGLPVMLGSLGLLILNVVAPQPYGGWTTVLEPSSMAFPSVRVSAVVGEVFSVLFLYCGWWTYRRRGGTPSQAGRTAATVCVLAGIPVVVIGALLLLGAIDLSVVGPGHSAADIQNRLTFTYYSADGHSVSPLMVMLFPLSRVPIAWLWGSLGGYAARWTAPESQLN